jgi:MFS family permease
MAIVGCAMAFTGSQMIPLFFFTLYTSIANSLGAVSFIWLAAGSQVGQVAASVSIGPLSDLLGRKASFVLGVVLSMIGMIVCAATPTPSGFIAGQVISGFGLILEELLSIAVISELVPTTKRTLYGGIMIAGFIPWAPGALYAQLLANRSWRWVATLIAVW